MSYGFTVDELTAIQTALAHEYEKQSKEFEKELYSGNQRDDIGQPCHGQAVTKVVKDYWTPILQSLVDLQSKVQGFITTPDSQWAGSAHPALAEQAVNVMRSAAELREAAPPAVGNLGQPGPPDANANVEPNGG